MLFLTHRYDRDLENAWLAPARGRGCRASIAPRVLLVALVATAGTSSAEVVLRDPTFSSPTTFTHDYVPFEPGARKVYRGKVDGERLVVIEEHLSETRTFVWSGGLVETCVKREMEFVGGELSQRCDTFLAQSDDGSIFAFGMLAFEVEDNEVVYTGDSWLVGGPGDDDPRDASSVARPSLHMPANPTRADQFHPDPTGEVVTVDKFVARVTVESGAFADVMVTVKSDARGDDPERSWHARGVGVVKTVEEGERLQLISSTLLPPE